MPNAADRKSIRAQEKTARIADMQRRDVIVSLMSTAPGRQWLWNLLASTRMFHTTHTPGDPLASAFSEGRRSVGLDLLADIMAYTPDLYIQAMRESHERNLTADTIQRAVDSGADLSTPDAERPGSTVGDGGDSGAGADTDTPSTETFRSPGADIYVDRAAEAPRGEAAR